MSMRRRVVLPDSLIVPDHLRKRLEGVDGFRTDKKCTTCNSSLVFISGCCSNYAAWRCPKGCTQEDQK